MIFAELWLDQQAQEFLTVSQRDAWLSRHDLNGPKLMEVVIEGKSYFDTELFHDNLTCTVGKAPILVSSNFSNMLHASNKSEELILYMFAKRV